MRRLPSWTALALVCVLRSPPVRAGDPAAGAPKPPPARVHLGSTSVTVVDEHEPVDDVISRIRNRKNQVPAADKPKTGREQTQPSPAGTDGRRSGGRAGLQSQRDRATASDDANRGKDERRDRAAGTRSRLEQKHRR